MELSYNKKSAKFNKIFSEYKLKSKKLVIFEEKCVKINKNNENIQYKHNKVNREHNISENLLMGHKTKPNKPALIIKKIKYPELQLNIKIIQAITVNIQ